MFLRKVTFALDSQETHNSRLLLLLVLMLTTLTFSCNEEHEHVAPAINDKDSVPMMVSYGGKTLISDSGVIKYRIVTEKWEVNDKKNPSLWIFDKGLLLTQFDQTFHIQSYIQCDTAYYYDQRRMWLLRGRVRIHTKQGMRFASEELFWDEQSHELWSHKYSHLKTPDRELEGNYFRSDERMTKYIVTNTKGAFEKEDMGIGKPNPKDSMNNARRQDSIRNASSRDTSHMSTNAKESGKADKH